MYFELTRKYGIVSKGNSLIRHGMIFILRKHVGSEIYIGLFH